MKTIFISCILFLIPNLGRAQVQQETKQPVRLEAIYVSTGAAYSTYQISFNWGLGMMLNTHWGAMANFNYAVRNSTHIPSNYDPGLCILCDRTPNDDLKILSLRAAREFRLPQNDVVRFGIEGGVSYNMFQVKQFTFNPNAPVLESNYVVSTKQENYPGLTFRARTDFVLYQVVGIELAGVTSINTYESYFGLEANLLLGLLDRRERTKKSTD